MTDKINGTEPPNGQACAPRGAPAPWVVTHAGLVPAGGAVLDLACGSGRHCVVFADRGHAVYGVDRALGGIADLVAAGRVVAIHADLEGAPWPFDGRRFAGIVVTNYLWRPLLPLIVDAVAPGGALIYETFAAGQERFGRPNNPDFLLQPGELLDAVRGRLEVRAYRHGETAEPAMRQALAAVRV